MNATAMLPARRFEFATLDFMPRLPLLTVMVFAIGVVAFITSHAAPDGISRLGLVISEIMYQPEAPSPAENEAGFTADSFEYLEITNITSTPVPVSGLSIHGDVRFDFAEAGIEVLAPGEHVVLAKDAEAFVLRYGHEVPVLGVYAGALPDDGGELLIQDQSGSVGLSFGYGTGNRWPKTTQGMGFSLVLDSPATNPDHNVASHWRASARAGGSPGAVDPEAALLPVYINEIRPKEIVLDTYYRITGYPLTPEQAPTAFVTTFIGDMKADPYHFSFLHLVSPDFVGHSFNWGSPQQDDAIRAVDVDLGQVLQLVDTDTRLRGKTAILLTTDHGGGGGLPYHHLDPKSALNFTIHFHAWGPGIPAGAELYELNQNTRLLPDPETNPAYSLDTASMPIRNGDLGNLVLDLLGLPPIPGSWINHDHSLSVGADDSAIEYVIAISVDGLRPESIQRLGSEELPNLYRLRREGAFTDLGRTDVDSTLTNPNHTCMLTSRGTLDYEGVGKGHQVTFNDSVSETLESWNGIYIFSLFNVIKGAGKTASFYSNKAKLDFLGRSYGAIDGDVIELYNPNGVPVDVSGWRLTDDIARPGKFVIPNNHIVPAQGYLTLREDPLWRSPRRPNLTGFYFGSAFSLEPSGGELHLFSSSNGKLTGFDHGVAYGPLLHGSTLARQSSPDGDRFFMASRATIGGPNAQPFLSPLVLTEVNLDPGRGFVELRNVSSVAVQLGPAWKLTGLFDFSFPEGLVVGPGQFVVVSEDPALLEPEMPPAALLVGPLSPNASQSGGENREISLTHSSATVLVVVRAAVVDRVVLDEGGFWSQPAAGHTWEKRGHRSFSDTPLNWKASDEAGGTPGWVAHGRYEDWAERHLGGVAPALMAADADADGDGKSNLLEYAFATNPLDPRDAFEPIFRVPPGAAGQKTLAFRRPIEAVDLIYRAEVSTDLLNWRPSTNEVLELAERRPLDEDTIEVSMAVEFVGGAEFLRLQVSLAP